MNGRVGGNLGFAGNGFDVLSGKYWFPERGGVGLGLAVSCKSGAALGGKSGTDWWPVCGCRVCWRTTGGLRELDTGGSGSMG